MDFNFTGNNLTGREKALQRFFEIVPGATSWIILIGMAILAFYKPLVAAVIIIAFYFYWLLKLWYLTIFLILSYLRLSLEDRTDWMERVRGLDRLDRYLEELRNKPGPRDLRKRVSLFLHKKEVEGLFMSGVGRPLSKDIYHLVIIPVAKETRDVIEPGIRSLASGMFPSKQIVVFLALEERASEEVKEGVEGVRDDYIGRFYDMQIVTHPDGIAGEARAKGANTTYAAKKAAEYLRERNMPFENVVSSCFDSDTVVNPQYFASLTYYFQICPERTRASFQPVPMYNNNIWEAPGLTRVLETGSSFFQLIEATNPQTLVTFSSHSMSFKALEDVDYWPVDMISDDSAIFWKAFIHFDGGYRVVPMYTTLSMDAVVAENWWKTVVNVYKQKRRWAWGVENFPILIRAFLRDKKIPFFIKLKVGYKLFEGHISWATWAFLLTIVGWLPAIFAGREFSHSVFYYSAPRIAGTIFHLASFSLITSVILSLLLLPKKKIRYSFIKRVGFALQWLLVPVTMVFLSALPALDAQTRLMRAKYMTFWVTDKSRK
ncbi:MAG: glycosyltransferase family 2 protein [Candidatus Omnitrophota bacterium]|nr:glycosyltransferase family 2 protein [Candidatus Omnitrophota bacterium]